MVAVLRRRGRIGAGRGACLLGLLLARPGAAEGPDGEIRLGLGHERAVAPPGQGEARDRSRLFAEASLQVRPGLGLGVQLDGWRVDRSAASTSAGPGDVQLHAWAPLGDGRLPARLAGWIKLPNADDREGLGTDQADLHLAGQLGLHRERAGGQLWAGAASLGDPASAGRRWLVPEGELEGWWRPGALRLGAALGLRPLQTPARAGGLARLSLAAAGRWRWGGDLEFGLGEAGPRPGLRVWLGWASQGGQEEGRCCDGPLPEP